MPDPRPQRLAYAFVAPELSEPDTPNDVSEYEKRSSWDVAVRYQDLKRFGHIPEKEKLLLKKRAIEGVLDRAHRILGSVLKPERTELVDYRRFLETGARGELDVLETLDTALAHGTTPGKAFNYDVLKFDARIEKEFDIALVMDASLSMTGEKIALLAVATAVVAICVPPERLALMGFDSKTRWIKRFGEVRSVETIIERVLELPTGGFTNLELALTETLKGIAASGRKRANVILITDGKYTEGADPTPLAKRFKALNVLKIGRDQAGRDLLVDLKTQGNGRFFEARQISDLPRSMYGAIRTLLR